MRNIGFQGQNLQYGLALFVVSGGLSDVLWLGASVEVAALGTETSEGSARGAVVFPSSDVRESGVALFFNALPGTPW